jgi:phosphopantothenoylcysteine decarboxylase/phosphopantothenate--cysteine ligase
MKILQNKNIIVAVTGSIAIYKSLELIRLYIKAGANVKVILSNGAKKFINPITFETLSQNSVLDDTNENWDNSSINNHIAIGKWADIIVLAPATANTINKLANGIADNILLQTILAFPKQKLLCPAANTNMIHNPLTQANIKMLKLCNFELLNTQTKELACKDIGDGALANIDDIFHKTAQILLKTPYWTNRKVVLNGGGTIEKIDDIRYITNFSSGKMANALALALYYKGADVCLVSSSDIPMTPLIHTIKVQSASDMYEYVVSALKVAKKGKVTQATLMDSSQIELVQKKPFFFGVSAVSDYTPAFPQQGKLKKDDIGSNWDLKLKRNIDILKTIDKTGIYTIGFKAEMDKAKAKRNGIDMLNSKNLDGVCLNILDENNTFGSDTNNITLLLKEKEQNISGSKLRVALNILDTLGDSFE